MKKKEIQLIKKHIVRTITYKGKEIIKRKVGITQHKNPPKMKTLWHSPREFPNEYKQKKSYRNSFPETIIRASYYLIRIEHMLNYPIEQK